MYQLTIDDRAKTTPNLLSRTHKLGGILLGERISNTEVRDAHGTEEGDTQSKLIHFPHDGEVQKKGDQTVH